MQQKQLLQDCTVLPDTLMPHGQVPVHENELVTRDGVSASGPMHVVHDAPHQQPAARTRPATSKQDAAALANEKGREILLS
jgi:hypothetical protein